MAVSSAVVSNRNQSERFPNPPVSLREHFARQLSGKGLEIGPLHRPMLRHDGMDIDYVDRLTVAELRAHYPELKDLDLVEPHIISDAEKLSGVPDGKYDFVISAHVIEHMRDPIGSIENWLRVLKPDGLLYLVVPDKRRTFDVDRARTLIEHMVLDYRRPSLERDYEHFLDYVTNIHKKSGDDAIRDADDVCARDYSIHFHVFLPQDIVALLHWVAQNVAPLEIAEGPASEDGSEEFHLLIRKISKG